MYFVRVRDRIMIAHSFRGEIFGPAQRLHGASLIVEVELRGGRLTEEGFLVDITRLRELLSEILSEIDYHNLDELPVFAGRNTTVEVVAAHIHGRLREEIRAGRLGPGSRNLEEILVDIREHDLARAGYLGPA